MTTEVRKNMTTVVAGQALTADSVLHKACTVGGTIAASNDVAVGLIKSKAANGGAVSIAYEGEMKAWAGVGITAGNQLAVTTSGWIIAATASLGATRTVGRALETVASGDLFRGLFNFTNAA